MKTGAIPGKAVSLLPGAALHLFPLPLFLLLHIPKLSSPVGEHIL